jgi:hypothetical protein
MAYQVNKFNGETLVNVSDGTIDTTTDLRLVGKNYAGYGEVQNENFVHLLENFANTTAPPKALTGQIWYDSNSSNKKLKYYDGSRWKVAGGAEASPTAPTGLSTGDFWWDTTAKQLYAWTGTDFALVGPEASPDLGSSIISAAVVKGTISTDVGPHTVLKVIADDKVVGIFSRTAFTLDATQNAIEDFSVIKKGFTLAKSVSGVSTDDYVMWGTAQNANQLGGVPAANFLQVGDNEFTEEVLFKDPGYTVGDGNDLRVSIENGDEAIIENRLGNPITFRITVTENTDERDVLIVRPTGVFPGLSNTYKLGGTLPGSTAVIAWSEVNATTFNGSLVGNVTGNSTGTHTGNVLATDTTLMINATTKQIGYSGANLVGTLTGSCTGSAATATNAAQLNSLSPSVSVPVGSVQSIPVRDASGNITANQFVGISDKTDRMIINDAASDPTWNAGVTSTQYRSAKTTKTAYSIAARDSSGNLLANVFDGTATAAQYADLAEKYLPDAEYEVGTVVMIGGDKEITASSWGKRAIGVISANPAFMMNKELEGGVYVALKGRVPVKVVGRIKKGDDLIAANNGCAMMAVPHASGVFAVALENSDDEGVKIIEALVL